MNFILKGIYTALSTKFIYNHDLDIPAYLLNIKQQNRSRFSSSSNWDSIGEASVLTQDEE